MKLSRWPKGLIPDRSRQWRMWNWWLCASPKEALYRNLRTWVLTRRRIGLKVRRTGKKTKPRDTLQQGTHGQGDREQDRAENALHRCIDRRRETKRTPRDPTKKTMLQGRSNLVQGEPSMQCKKDKHTTTRQDSQYALAVLAKYASASRAKAQHCNGAMMRTRLLKTMMHCSVEV